MFREHFSLLIVDSVMGLFRSEFAGRGEVYYTIFQNIFYFDK